MQDGQPKPVPGMSTADWADAGATRWASVADHLEAQLQPVAALLAEAAAIQPGERVLDLGCGRGVTTRDAAAASGPSGAVSGIDVASMLLDHARSVPSTGAPIEWILGDAQTYPFTTGGVDVVISRFGVMFFDDVVEAFANVRRATARGGRLCVVVWQTRDRSEVFRRPLAVAVTAAADAGFALELPPSDQGPFALCDEPLVRSVLEEAGWTDVTFTPQMLDVYAFGPGPADRLAQTALSMGALHHALADAPSGVTERVTDALAADFLRDHDGVGVPMGAAVACVSASA
jgi:SAM-dependent methyltransferase